MVGSMDRVGAAGDNAATGSFFSLFHKNVLNRQTWAPAKNSASPSTNGTRVELLRVVAKRDDWSMSDDRGQLRATFDSAADLYQHARPEYPEAVARRVGRDRWTECG
jgi:hypothetical protein